MADNNNNNKLELFELPRKDWFDEDGRIYKDALIDNLNAIEEKLNEIAMISAFSAEPPDVSGLSLGDVTLADADNKVVNLKSFLDIFNLYNYPLELEFSGTTIKKISYWTEDFQYLTAKDITTNASDDAKFIYFDFTTKEASSSADGTLGTAGKSIIGVYTNGRVITLHAAKSAKLNLMYLLANMAKRSTYHNVRAGTDYYWSSSGQQNAIGHVESKGYEHAGWMNFNEWGV